MPVNVPARLVHTRLNSGYSVSLPHKYSLSNEEIEEHGSESWRYYRPAADQSSGRSSVSQYNIASLSCMDYLELSRSDRTVATAFFHVKAKESTFQVGHHSLKPERD